MPDTTKHFTMNRFTLLDALKKQALPDIIVTVPAENLTENTVESLPQEIEPLKKSLEKVEEGNKTSQPELNSSETHNTSIEIPVPSASGNSMTQSSSEYNMNKGTPETREHKNRCRLM